MTFDCFITICGIIQKKNMFNENINSVMLIILTKEHEHAVPAFDRICVTVLIRNGFYTPH